MWECDSIVLELHFVSLNYVHNYKLHAANKNVTLLTNPTSEKETSEMQNNIINIHHSSTSDRKQFNMMKLWKGFQEIKTLDLIIFYLIKIL